MKIIAVIFGVGLFQTILQDLKFPASSELQLHNATSNLFFDPFNDA